MSTNPKLPPVPAGKPLAKVQKRTNSKTGKASWAVVVLGGDGKYALGTAKSDGGFPPCPLVFETKARAEGFCNWANKNPDDAFEPASKRTITGKPKRSLGAILDLLEEKTRTELAELAREHGTRSRGTKEAILNDLADHLHACRWTATVTLSEP